MGQIQVMLTIGSMICGQTSGSIHPITLWSWWPIRSCARGGPVHPRGRAPMIDGAAVSRAGGGERTQACERAVAFLSGAASGVVARFSACARPERRMGHRVRGDDVGVVLRAGSAGDGTRGMGSAHGARTALGSMGLQQRHAGRPPTARVGNPARGGVGRG